MKGRIRELLALGRSAGLLAGLVRPVYRSGRSGLRSSVIADLSRLPALFVRCKPAICRRSAKDSRIRPPIRRLWARGTSLISPKPPSHWGESGREGNLSQSRLPSPSLSSFRRQAEREKGSAIGHFGPGWVRPPVRRFTEPPAPWFWDWGNSGPVARPTVRPEV